MSAVAIDHRLSRLHARLTDPGSAAIAIAVLAFDAGFSDLSTFNRAFRRRYGATPSDVRAAALDAKA
jgi:AraC-like DNA-binding protein